MAQIIQTPFNPKRCNLAAIQSGGSQANTVLANGEIWFVDTTNANKGTKGYGHYDAYIVGDGETGASALEVNPIDDMSAFATKQELAAKQDVINDLATIRSGAVAGATAYQKPSGGIPASDMSAAVQTSLSKADSASIIAQVQDAINSNKYQVLTNNEQDITNLVQGYYDDNGIFNETDDNNQKCQAVTLTQGKAYYLYKTSNTNAKQSVMFLDSNNNVIYRSGINVEYDRWFLFGSDISKLLLNYYGHTRSTCRISIADFLEYYSPIDESKTIFFDKTRNVFTPKSIKTGTLIADRYNYPTYPTYITYFGIPVEAGETYVISVGGEQVSFMRIRGTDQNGNYISNSYEVDRLSYTVPQGASFIDISMTRSTVEGKSIQIEKTSVTQYIYPYAIKERYSPSISIADNSITNSKLQDGAVTEEKTVFFDSSYNLLNPNDNGVEDGYLNGSGTVSASTSYKTSGFIPVTPSTLYYLTSLDKEITARCVCCYNSSKVYIAGTLKTIVSSITTNVNAAFIRVSYNVAGDFWANGQVTSTEKKTYEPYGFTLKEKYIPEITPAPIEEVYPQIVMPSAVYALKGSENSIYHKNIIEYQHPLYYINKYGGVWNYSERYERTNANAAGNFSVRLKSLVDLTTKQTISVPTCIGDPMTDNGLKNVNIIGDSFTYNGTWFDQINTICPNLKFVGMRKSANTDTALRAEGRGGWRLATYFQPYDDLTPNHMSSFSPFMHVSGYTYYGPIEFWKAIVTGTSQYTYGTNGFDDYISWFDNNGYKTNPSVNDLMYDGTNDKFVYWNGSSWVDFSGTPTFVFNYAKYVDTWNIDSPDFVLIMLGVNDWFGQYSDALASEWNTRMDTFISSVQSYAQSVNKTIVIGICTNTTIIGLPNNAYYSNIAENSRYEFLGRKNTIETFDNDTYKNQNVFVVDTGACLDTDYGFVTQEVKPFDFYTGGLRELYDANGVHPSEDGYKQLGTCAAGFIQYIRGM